MQLADALIVVVAVGTAALAARPLWRDPHLPPVARVSVALFAAVAAAFALVAAAGVWLGGTNDPWNAARLTPSIALHHGYSLYYPVDHGPVLSTVVGPMAFLFYWPVGFLPGVSPTTLILAASFVNLGGLALLARWVLGRSTEDSSLRVLASVVAAHLVLHFASLRYSLFCIHADAPALLLGGFGAALLAFAGTSLSWPRAFLAALCFGCAVWAKQSVAPIYVAGIGIAALTGGFTSSKRFVITSAVTGLIVSCLFVVWLGYEPLRDNMFGVPAHHPWFKVKLATGEVDRALVATGAIGHLKSLVGVILHLMRSNWPLFVVLVAAVLDHLVRRGSGAPWWPRTRWFAFLLVAFCLFPTAAIGRAKVGGEVNHESFVVFFVVAAFVCWLVESPADRLGRTVRLSAVLLLLTLVNAPLFLEYRGWGASWRNQNEVAAQYDIRQPGRVYFPWNPLTSLLSEGRLYHFDYAVFDRNLGGFRVTPTHLARELPSPRPIIASYYAHHDYILHEYFPDYVLLAADPELPGWRLYGPP